MSDTNVRIVKLDPLRVASAQGFGASPEAQAWDKLKAWMEQQGMMADLKSHRFFGFNNPNPAPGSPNYGYEQWTTVSKDVVPGAVIRVMDFAGGLYAVMRAKFDGDMGEQFPEAWKRLVLWREKSRYKPATHQWLEEAIVSETGELSFREFDLYLPIAE